MISPKAFVHPRALVDPGATVGAGTRVWAFAHVVKGAVVGDDCNLCDHTFVEGKVILGNRVTVKCGVFLWDGVVVEDNVFIAPGAGLVNDLRPRSRNYPDQFLKPICSRAVAWAPMRPFYPSPSVAGPWSPPARWSRVMSLRTRWSEGFRHG